MKILISGATGFVGQNWLKYASEMHPDWEHVLLSRDLLQMENFDSMLQGIDIVLHFAGKAHDVKKVSHDDEYYQVNFELTKKIYRSFLRSNASKFVFISSIKAVIDHSNFIITEDISPCPKTHYGRSKLLAEEFIKEQRIHPHQSYFILRPSMIHGPSNKGNLTLLYKFVKSGIPYPLGAFNNARSLLSIENFCFVINQIVLNEKIKSGVYNVCDQKPLSTLQIVKLIRETLNRSSYKIWSVPQPFIRFMAFIGTILNLPFSRERLQKLTENFIISNEKLKRAIGKELPVKAEEGLKLTIRSFDDSI